MSMFNPIKKWPFFKKAAVHDSTAVDILPEQVAISDNRDAFTEILLTEKLLQRIGFAKNCWQTQVLAREICLIDRIADEYDFDSWYQSDRARHALRAQVARELSLESIPLNDDDIRIGNGGCKPRSEPRSERKAIIILGLPASGKSTVAQQMSDAMGAFIIDSDFAKRKFPEIAFPNGAGWTHEESNRVVFREDGGPLAACLGFGHNMIIPKIGSSAKGIIELKQYLESMQYDVSLALVWLEPQKAMKRAVHRYQETKRYIPMAVLEGYGSKPLDVFNKLIAEHHWESFIHLSSDVDKGCPCEVISKSEGSLWW
ncbi:zeta toxin family protein [Vibrio fluvialis]